MLLLVWLIIIAVQLSAKPALKSISSQGQWVIRGVWIIVLLQIMLGGWVSTNYAAGACGSTFPLCRGEWMPHAIQWQPALEVGHALGYTLLGDRFPAGALVAIHLMHRTGAAVITLAVTGLVAYLMRRREWKWSGLLIMSLVLQLLLGFANIHWNLPLAIAVAHNGGAALLLALLTILGSGARYTAQVALSDSYREAS